MDVPQKRARSSEHEEKAVVSKIHRNRFKNAHYVDLATDTYYFHTLGSVTLVPTIPQGTSEMERLGKRVRLKSFQMHGVLSIGTAAPLQPLIALVLLVYDRNPQYSITTAGIADILSGTLALGFPRDENSDRFRIVMRRSYALNYIIQNPITVDEYIPLEGLSTEYGSAATGAISNIRKGSLLLVCAGLEAAIPPYATAARLYAQARVRFINEV